MPRSTRDSSTPVGVRYFATRPAAIYRHVGEFLYAHRREVLRDPTGTGRALTWANVAPPRTVVPVACIWTSELARTSRLRWQGLARVKLSGSLPCTP